MIRVLLADDEDLIRVALAALLGLEPDLDVVAQASDGRAAVDAALAHRPDVAVVDLEMPRWTVWRSPPSWLGRCRHARW